MSDCFVRTNPSIDDPSNDLAVGPLRTDSLGISTFLIDAGDVQ